VSVEGPAGNVESKSKGRSGTEAKPLSPRDYATLSWIAEQYAARVDQVERLLARDAVRRAGAPVEIIPRSVYRALGRWRRPGAEMVEHRRIYYAEPGWCWLTPLGLRLLKNPYARLTPAPSTLPHLYQINRIRLDIERRHPEYRWVSERSLRAQLPRREAGAALPHTPDAQVWVPNSRETGEKAVAVEVELSVKSDQELDGIFTELLMARSEARGGFFMYASVWYFVTPLTRRVIEKARDRLPPAARQRVAVISLDALCPA
jgi:hypothetical protein